MLQLFKYLFTKIYLFYQDVLQVRSRTHFYTSFVLSLLVFGNIFVLGNSFALLFFGRMAFGVHSSYFLYIGNAVMFSILIVVSIKKNYLLVINEIKLLRNEDKERLLRISKIYVVISILVLFPFFLVSCKGYSKDEVNKLIVSEQPCEPPAKPQSVPKNAKWFGGCDGGDWIELVSIANGKFRFKVYRDWDGTLNIDSDFSSNCNLNLTEQNWEKLIERYDHGDSDSSVNILIKDQSKNCLLESIYPAYGGLDWEILNEKRE